MGALLRAGCLVEVRAATLQNVWERVNPAWLRNVRLIDFGGALLSVPTSAALGILTQRGRPAPHV